MTDSPTQPVYRVTVSCEPDFPGDSLPYIARVYQDADGAYVHTVWDDEPLAALQRARAWVIGQCEPNPVTTYYLDALGRVICTPHYGHSVKA